MGMFKFFSADSRDNTQLISTNKVIEKMIRVNSTPNPRNFKVIRKEIINGYPILLINYPDVSNYEGNKILFYPKFFDIEYLLSKNCIDPHFFTEGDSPIARFEPTKEGWKNAKILAKNLP